MAYETSNEYFMFFFISVSSNSLWYKKSWWDIKRRNIKQNKKRDSIARLTVVVFSHHQQPEKAIFHQYRSYALLNYHPWTRFISVLCHAQAVPKGGRIADLDLRQSSPEAGSRLFAGCVSIDDKDPDFRVVENMGVTRLTDRVGLTEPKLNCTTARRVMHSRVIATSNRSDNKNQISKFQSMQLNLLSFWASSMQNIMLFSRRKALIHQFLQILSFEIALINPQTLYSVPSETGYGGKNLIRRITEPFFQKNACFYYTSWKKEMHKAELTDIW